MSNPTVLFVDDEPNVLRGLKRMLRPERNRWDMVFMEGGPEAIQWLSENDVDAIVSDMRMPVKDGADVLNFAAENNKGYVRIVLSGEADKELTYRTVLSSHQFLSKPCQNIELVRAIDLPVSFLGRLSSNDQARVASALRTLPCAADIVAQAKKALSREAGLSEFANIVSKEPTLALRIFQLANSAYFGKPANTLSIYEAVTTIGSDVLRSLLETNRLVDQVTTESNNEALKDISSCAVKCAQMLYELALERGTSETEAEAAYSTGLLSWAGDSLVAGTDMGLDAASLHLNAISVSGYAACLLGIPAHMSAVISSLNTQQSDRFVDPSDRANALASLMFDKAVA
ncbi:HDOD domain-containing protein [Hirschia baltica]|uniref:Response regulator receiver protein n=1 Tax=Hirschia baltica (strain ATCC 49814 / DSM 5838 / IFAM 1418) TaxID=582402 RepID=C6XR17_HIRBI|nr:HDOD domain-containing protein [Hirschia baltica]ACT60548.1 response regulator receiver protein [Hirschia baltica ATCC 49814]